MSNTVQRVSDFLIAAISCQQSSLPEDIRGADWDAIWTKVRDHCIAPYLHKRWSDSGTLQALPQHFIDRLAGARARNSERNRRLTATLQEIHRSLEGEDLPILTSKGLSVAQEFYGDLGLRVLYDLDLIVQSGHRARAAALLESLGYRPFFTRRNSPKEGELFWRPQPYRWAPDLVFEPDQPVFVELHTMPWLPRWHGLGVECHLDLWDGHRELDVSGIPLRVPSREKLLVHLAVHYALNVLESSARLMHLVDIVLMLERHEDELDWERVWDEIERSRVAPLCCISLALSEHIRGRFIPQRIRNRIWKATPRALTDWLCSRALRDVARVNIHNRDYSLIYFLHWHAAAAWSEKIRVLAYSCRAPLSEAAGGFAGCRVLARRMVHRMRNLAGVLET